MKEETILEKTGSLKNFYARVSAVQSLFVLFFEEGRTLENLDSCFDSALFAVDEEDEQIVSQKADKRLSREIIEGVLEKKEKIDTRINTYTNVDNMDGVSLNLFRSAVFEMLYREKTPTVVAISEYTKISDLFFGTKKASFVNAILDKISKEG